MIRWNLIIDGWGFPVFHGVKSIPIIAAAAEKIIEDIQPVIPEFPDTPQGRYDQYFWERDRPDRPEPEYDRPMDWQYEDEGYYHQYAWEVGGGFSDETLGGGETWYPLG